jgi:hypothetical protein
VRSGLVKSHGSFKGKPDLACHNHVEGFGRLILSHYDLLRRHTAHDSVSGERVDVARRKGFKKRRLLEKLGG